MEAVLQRRGYMSLRFRVSHWLISNVLTPMSYFVTFQAEVCVFLASPHGLGKGSFPGAVQRTVISEEQ